MSYSVNWATKVITIPKADTQLVSTSPDVRSLDVTVLWQNLRDIEDDVDGISYVAIVKNTTPVTLAGVTLARQVEVINGYRLMFEDGQYAVNIVGGNSNIGDVVVKNQVSVNTANSAGFIQVSGGGTTDFDDLFNKMLDGSLTFRDAMRIMLSVLSGKVSGAGTGTIRFRDPTDTKDRVVANTDNIGNRASVTVDGS